MKQSLKIFFLTFVAITFLSSCASIFSKSVYPLTVNTSPSEANVTITDEKGTEIFKGNSPANVRLKASTGFFKKASYTVNVSKEGFGTKSLPVNFKIDGWYFGNLLLGGVVGMLIIDPATGAMYKIDSELMNVNLNKETSSIEQPTLKVYDIVNIPQNWRNKLVRINP